MPGNNQSPDRKTVIVGKAICRLAAVAPWAWPLVGSSVGRFFDRAAAGWDERTSAGSASHLAALAAGLDALQAKPERVLDLGCGTGAGSLFLAREFPTASIRGVDISESMIGQARGKIGLDPEGRVGFRVGDASSLPFADDSFDLVTQVNMPVFFREIARVLRPGGGVILATSHGDHTPFSTPERLVRRKLTSQGFAAIGSGAAGEGTWISARLDESR